MEAKTNSRVQRSTEEWQQILNWFAESGRSRAAFCRAEGIAPATFDLCCSGIKGRRYRLRDLERVATERT